MSPFPSALSWVPGPRQVVREGLILAGLPWGAAVLAARNMLPCTPVRRTEEPGDLRDLPPDLPGIVARDQTVDDGVGPVLHREFRTRIEDPRLGAAELVEALAADMNAAMVSGVARFDRIGGAGGTMAVGEEWVVRMPGPWDGPVRVVHRDATSFRLATLQGHLEAGQIEFAACPDGDAVRFSVTTWARAGDVVVDLLYNHVGLAKEVQFQLWVNVCVRSAAVAGGRAPEGVAVRTRRLPWADVLARRPERISAQV